jgi:hypothetical protein
LLNGKREEGKMNNGTALIIFLIGLGFTITWLYYGKRLADANEAARKSEKSFLRWAALAVFFVVIALVANYVEGKQLIAREEAAGVLVVAMVFVALSQWFRRKAGGRKSN